MKVSEIKVSYKNLNPSKVQISNSKIAYDLVLQHWHCDLIEFQEMVKVVLLNNSNIVLGIYDLSKGGISSSIVDVRIILSIALKCLASSIIIVHNHPSGTLKPSEQYMSLTTKIKNACEMIDLKLLDHLIISRSNYYSFADSGDL